MFEDNIMKVFNESSEYEKAEGKIWYQYAYDRSVTMAKGNAVIGAGVIAALSPNLSWDINLRLAERVIRTRRYYGHYRNTLDKARRIIKGENPCTVLGGWKTRNFYECILHAGDTNAVTIDRHAIAICLGRVATDKERQAVRYTASGKKIYDTYADAYREVAKEVELRPSEVQAITWVTWRNRDKELSDGLPF